MFKKIKENWPVIVAAVVITAIALPFILPLIAKVKGLIPGVSKAA